MKAVLRGFAKNLEDLREFVDLLAPVLSGRQESQFKQDANALAPLLLAIYELEPTFVSDKGEVQKKLQSKIGEKVEIARDANHPDRISLTVKGDLERPFNDALTRIAKGAGQIAILYRSALISLVSASEWYLSQLLHRYFDRYPEAAGSTEKTFSLKDLKNLGSISDAAEYLIDSKVEDILRGSFEDWTKFLRNGPKLSMGYLDIDQDDLVEVFQRRNVIIHNGGVANRQYCSHVSEKHRNGIELGKSLAVDRGYLDRAISMFERSFLLVGAELWKKLDIEDGERGDVLIDLAFKHLQADRWRVAESLSYFVAHDVKLPERSKMIAKVNYWQAIKWQDRFDEIRNEVVSEDVSAKEEIYRLAKHALLDEEDLFVELLERMLTEKKIQITDARSWPLFRKMRDLPRVKALVEDSKIAAPATVGADT